MEPSQELRAKLFQRLQKIEGAAAEVAYEASRRSVAKEQAPVQPLCHGSCFFTQSSGKSDEGHRAVEGLPGGPRRRVLVPSWVHDGDLRPLNPAQFHMMRQGSSGNSRSAANCSSSEVLRRRLKRCQQERDLALRGAEEAKAEYDERGADLEVEAKRLRGLAASLREQLTSAKRAVEQQREALYTAGSGGSSGSSAICRTSHRMPTTAALVEDQQRAQDRCSILKVRLSSLEAELEHQAACSQQLQQELQAREDGEELVQRRLEAFRPQRLGHSSVDSGSAASSPTLGRVAPPSRAQCTVSALPPPATQLDAEDGIAEAEGESKAGANDLEFSYDWGLGLSGRMSVERALRLARWAAHSVSDRDAALAPEREVTPQEDNFEGPLNELQRALEVLSRASKQRGPADGAAKVEDFPSDPPAFAAPIASLELALLQLQGRQADKFSVEVPDDPDKLSGLHMESEVVAEEPSSEGLHVFELEIENLQRALSRLTKRDTELEVADFDSLTLATEPKVEETDAFAAPTAELQEALAKLVSAPVLPGVLEEAFPDTPATATPAAMVPNDDLPKSDRGSPPSALAGNSETGERPEVGAVPLLSPLLSPLSMGAAQALIRKRYGSSEIRAG